MKWFDQPIHRWYFITEGLPIPLVRQQLRHTKGPVLDPFLGTGTVLVEAGLGGIRATGVDINPFMCFASQVKTGSYERDEIRSALEYVLKGKFGRFATSYESPESSRLGRYYTASAFRKLHSLRARILSISDSTLRRLFLLCFADVAVKTSKMRKSPAPRFKVGPRRAYCVLHEFRRKIEQVMQDVEQANNSDSPHRRPEILRGDSRHLAFLKDDYDLVITSPPYCNNVDFVRHSQLELLWLGFAMDGTDLGKLRHAAITSCEAMAHHNKDLGRLPPRIERIVEKIRRRSDRHYHEAVRQYFVGMSANFDSVYEALRARGKATYVIGDSWFQGVYVPTHIFLRSFARKSGFKSAKVHWLRRRLAGRPHNHCLSEYIIEARK
jgi:hypothetical protein